MLMVKMLDAMVNMFSELVYGVAVLLVITVRKAYEYRMLLLFLGFMAFVALGGLFTYCSLV